MLQALRLINPPGRRRRKASAKKAKSWPKYATGTSRNKPKPKRRKTVAKPIKTVRTARGTRYMRGGRFISKAAAKRSRAAKKRATTKKAAPKKRVRKAAPKKRVVRKAAAPKRRRTAKRAATPRKDPRRVAAGKKAARTRKRRAAAPKKAARKRKKTTTTKRRKPVAKKKRITKAMRQRWGRKGGKAAAKKRGRKKTTRKAAPKRRRRKAAPKRRRRARAVKTVMLRPARKRKGRKKAHKIIRRKRRYTVKQARKNPMKTMKAALMKGAAFWAGLTGMRVINNALKIHVTDRFAASLPAQIAPLLPSLAGFLASTLVVPRVTKKKTFIDALQMGATVAMIDAVFNQFVRPALPVSVAPYLSGYGEMTVYEPVSEYVDYDNRLGDVGDMAEYVPDNRYGQFQVTEALAMDEIDYMQRGGAGGIFAKTTLGRG